MYTTPISLIKWQLMERTNYIPVLFYCREILPGRKAVEGRRAADQLFRRRRGGKQCNDQFQGTRIARRRQEERVIGEDERGQRQLVDGLLDK